MNGPFDLHQYFCFTCRSTDWIIFHLFGSFGTVFTFDNFFTVFTFDNFFTFFTVFNCFPFHCFSFFFKDLATASEDNYTFNVVRKILQVVVPALPAKHMHAVMNVFVGSFGKMELVFLDNFWVFCC